MDSKFYFIKKINQISNDVFEADIYLSLESDYYFQTAARYRDVSVVPGSFQMEFIAEFSSLVFGIDSLQKLQIEDVQFLQVPKFLKPEVRLKIIGQRLGSDLLCCEIRSTVWSKTGIALKENVHTRLNARRVAPVPKPFPLSFDEISSYLDPDIPQVLYHPNAPLCLGKYFNSVGETLVWDNKRKSRYTPPRDLEVRIWGRQVAPPLIMDAVMQNGIIRQGSALEVGIPKGIGRVRFFANGINESSFTQEPALYFYAELHDSEKGVKTMQVVDSRGQVLIEFNNVTFTAFGFLNPRTGQIINSKPEDANAAKKTA
jgi:hypothetical protein